MRKGKRMFLQELDKCESYDPKRHPSSENANRKCFNSIDIHALSIIINSIKGVHKHFDDQTY